MPSTGWGFYPLNGQAQCTSVLLYRAYRSGLINCWPILNVIELRLPWIGLCLSCKELCQDEIRFYKVPDGCRSHSKALIFQRAIMLLDLKFRLKCATSSLCSIWLEVIKHNGERPQTVPWSSQLFWVWLEVEVTQWSKQKLLWEGCLLSKHRCLVLAVPSVLECMPRSSQVIVLYSIC